MSFQKDKKVFKIVVLGDSNVGKTCLTYRFCEGKLLGIHKATVGVDFRVRLLDIKGEQVKLFIWDTAGMEKYRKSLADQYYRNAHAVVIVYDLTNIKSFQNVAGWLEDCENHGLTSEVPRILVGNKCDSTDSLVVSTNMAQRFADSHGMPLFETSALLESEASNIEAIFVTLALNLVKVHPMIMTTPQQGNVLALTGPDSGPSGARRARWCCW